MQKYLAKGYIPEWAEELYATKEVNNTVTWTKIIKDSNQN